MPQILQFLHHSMVECTTATKKHEQDGKTLQPWMNQVCLVEQRVDEVFKLNPTPFLMSWWESNESYEPNMDSE